MAGALGGAMIFFSLLVGLILLGLIVFGYTAHVFVTVIEQTAAGNDEVHMPDEPYLDWMWKLFYLAWLLAMSVVPIWLLLPYLKVSSQQAIFLLVGVPALLFPVQVISSMTASSRLVALRLDTVFRLLGRLDAAFVFYVVTLPLTAACVALFLASVPYPVILPVAGLASAALVLLYGRLLGRLAWLLYPHEPEDDKKPEPKPPPELKKVKTQDPWAVPDEPAPKPEATKKAAPPKNGTAGTYGLQDDAGLTPQPAKKSEEPVESYGVLPAAEVKRALVVTEPATAPKTPFAKREAELTRPLAFPELPPHPMSSGVYDFPFYGSTRGPLVYLTLGYTCMGAVFWVMLQFLPG